MAHSTLLCPAQVGTFFFICCRNKIKQQEKKNEAASRPDSVLDISANLPQTLELELAAPTCTLSNFDLQQLLLLLTGPLEPAPPPSTSPPLTPTVHFPLWVHLWYAQC